MRIRFYFFGELLERPPPEGLPVVLGHPPPFPCPRPWLELLLDWLLELKYIGDALLIPLFQARKLILRNYHLQKIPVTIIWSPNDPIIDPQAVRKILNHKMYSQKGDFTCPYHELCTTYMSGKQVCQQVLL